MRGNHNNSYEGSQPGHQYQLTVLWWRQLPVRSFPTRNTQMPWEEFCKLLYWDWLATGHPLAPLSLLGEWVWLWTSEGTQKWKWLSSKAKFPWPEKRMKSALYSLISCFWLVCLYPISNTFLLKLLYVLAPNYTNPHLYSVWKKKKLWQNNRISSREIKINNPWRT